MILLGMPQLYEYDNIEDNLKLAKELGLDFPVFSGFRNKLTKSRGLFQGFLQLFVLLP